MDFNNIVYHNQEIISISIQRRNYVLLKDRICLDKHLHPY
jgi:hypothetical protein